MSKNQDVHHVKVLFDIENDDGTIDVEGIWAIPTPNGHRIDNVPFYAKGLACNDEISAALDADGMLHFVELLTPSGHSTVRLWFANESDVQLVRDTLRIMGCSSELDLSRLVAVDIPPTVSYSHVQKYLERQESAGILEYEEACLA